MLASVFCVKLSLRPAAGPFAWGKGSCLELAFARQTWQDAWLRAEDQDGQEQLADILDRLNAWDPSPSVAGAQKASTR